MRTALLSAAAAAVLTFSANAAFAQSIEGQYSMVGVNQDKSTYSGAVEIKKIGPGYQIMWDLDGEKVYGAGMMDGGALYVGSVYDKKSIVAVMKPDGANFKGVWYQRAENGLGEEAWLKR